MWKALAVLALVGLFLVGSLMTLKYTAHLGVPRKRPGCRGSPRSSEAKNATGHTTVTRTDDADGLQSPCDDHTTKHERDG